MHHYERYLLPWQSSLYVRAGPRWGRLPERSLRVAAFMHSQAVSVPFERSCNDDEAVARRPYLERASTEHRLAGLDL